ncbi:MAG: succinate dehydrogenase, hydrophobic membrane anchor protein [Pseudomonadota bacterium]
MKFATDRKRAQGLGSGHEGTHHHWQMIVSSMALVVVVPAFVITFALGLGGTYEEVLAFYGRPIPAMVIILSLIVGILHLMSEAIVAIEDYVPGVPGKLTIIGVTAFSYTLIAVGIFAVAKIAI